MGPLASQALVVTVFALILTGLNELRIWWENKR
jgi:hypothetical protein